MRITSRLVFVLGSLPAALSAQVARTYRVRVPDLSWVTPVVARAQAQAATALAQAEPALAGIGPALAAARPAMASAEAALAQMGPALRHAAIAGSRAATLGATVIRAWDWDLNQAGFAESPPEPWAQQDPADQLYKDARAALNRSRFTTAADLFEQIYTKHPRSSYAGDAYYWQAYALSRKDNDESYRKALDVLELQRQRAPNASTRSDARTLATRISGKLAANGNAAEAETIATIATGATGTTVTVAPRGGAPTTVTTRPTQRRTTKCDDDDEIQTAALNALQQMDADRAMPILRKVLARRDEGSACLRRRAVFIISQHEGRESESMLLEAARSDPDSEVREQAVFWLSQTRSPSATVALDSILRNAEDPVLQDKAIFALSQQDTPRARQALRDFALRTNISDELREKAIFWISQGNDPERLDFLKSLYAQIKKQNLRDKILFSVSQISGRESSQWLLGVAGDVNEDIELRKKALFWVGQSDYPFSELTTLYERMPSREMKEQLIFVYSQRSEKAAIDRLMQIARTETDRELRKKAIFWLGQSGDPRVAEFLASLLEKPQ